MAVVLDRVRPLGDQALPVAGPFGPDWGPGSLGHAGPGVDARFQADDSEMVPPSATGVSWHTL